MHVFLIPFWVFVTMIVLAWLGVAYHFWFKPTVRPKLADHFAQRRHIRRLRNYAARDAALTMRIYDVNTTRKAEVYNAPARHRR